MSYCRWSSDDFQCDVYCYEHVHGGFVVHIATNRPVFNDPLPPPAGDTKGWIERHMKVSQMMRGAEHKAIGLEHDGETMNTDTAEDMADLLESLRAKGYNVPQYAIDGLREDAEGEEH